MKTLAAVLAVAIAALAAPVRAQDEIKDVGVGVIVGDPIGGTMKLWLNDRLAFDLGIGYSGDTVMWGDVLLHAWDLLPKPTEGKLGVYVGAGPRLETRRDAEFAIRTIAGVSWRLDKQPVELFAEAGPLFRMTPRGGVGADAGVGLRIYLGR